MVGVSEREASPGPWFRAALETCVVGSQSLFRAATPWH
jgi:hypothetical protein